MPSWKAAAQQALEALENVITAHGYEGGTPVRARDALRAALAEPVQGQVWVKEELPPPYVARSPIEVEPVQEPVAWQWLDTAHFRKKIPADSTPSEWRPLYTAPPQRKPLTEAQIYAAIKGVDSLKAVEVARAVEKAHGIGESK